MIFCFPLNFLSQPLSQVMDSFIPQSSSSFTPPNHHPHPSLLHSIHSPIYPPGVTGPPIQLHSPVHQSSNLPIICPPAQPHIHLSIHSPNLLFTHPCSLLLTLHHLIHWTISLLYLCIQHSPGSQPATFHPSSSVSPVRPFIRQFMGPRLCQAPGALFHV